MIEEGLRILDAHLRAGPHGLIDLFGIDSRGDFVLLALEAGGEEDLLHRIRGQHAWVMAHLPFLASMYRTIPGSLVRRPRVIILSDGYSDDIIEEARRLQVPLTCFLYEIFLCGERPLLCLESFDPAHDAAEPAEPENPELVVPGPERLSPEEWEEFYGFEQRRLATGDREGIAH